MLAAAAALIPILAPLIPQIASWLGGDDAEDVARQVTAAVSSVAGSTDPAVVAATIADPQRGGQLAAELARIAAERARAEREAQIAEITARLADTADARRQTVTLAQAGSRIAWAAPVMSLVILAGFFACLGMMFLIERTWDERTAALLNVLFGALTISFGQVCNYWLGSSRGSAAKDERQAVPMVQGLAAAVEAAPQPRAFAR